MAWFKIDDGFYDHPKFLDLSNGAVGLWAKAGAWCGKHLTDGLIPASKVKMLKGTASQIRALVDAELWLEAVTESGAKAYQFHDWTDFQPSREQKLQERADAAERQRLSRERREMETTSDPKQTRNESEMHSKSNPKWFESGPQSDRNWNANAHEFDSKSNLRNTQDQHERGNVTRDSHVTGPRDSRVSHTQVSQRPDPTRPDPTPPPTPSQSPSGDMGGGLPPPGNLDPDNPRCDHHTHIPPGERGPNCLACRRVRQWCEQAPDRAHAERARTAAAARARIAECARCDDAGWLLDHDGTPVEPAVRCNHPVAQEAQHA